MKSRRRRRRNMELTTESPDNMFNAFAYAGVSLSEIRDLIMKNYLYKVYVKEIIDKNLQVTKIFGLHSLDSPIPGVLNVDYDRQNKYYRISEAILFIS